MTKRRANIIAPDTVPCRMATGFGFTEGPVWLADRGAILFSDISGNSMHLLHIDGRTEVYRAPSDFANGSTLDNEGRVITCEHGTSRVVREEHDGKLCVLASHWHGSKLNSPNDVIVDSHGAIWFTDPIYGRLPEYGIEREQELEFQGVFRLDPDGTLALVVDDFDQPNGLCLNLDETELMVSDTRRFHIRRFRVANGIETLGGEVFAETHGSLPGCPDGLKFDANGNLFSCGPGGIQVFDPKGTLIQILEFPEEVTNFAWGGDDLCSLFVTAQTSIYQLRLTHPGRAMPTISA